MLQKIDSLELDLDEANQQITILKKQAQSV